MGSKEGENPSNFVEELPDDAASPREENAPSANASHSMEIDNWTTHDVVNWIKTLKLSQDYSSLIAIQNINGVLLWGISESEWKEIGITKATDIKTLQEARKQLLGIK